MKNLKRMLLLEEINTANVVNTDLGRWALRLTSPIIVNVSAINKAQGTCPPQKQIPEAVEGRKLEFSIIINTHFRE
jgi:hypothetical protein